jgi:acyl transferase domain-containing protein
VTAKVLPLVDRLSVVLQLDEARKLARAIRATQARSRDGFMAYGTMKSHVESLRGAAQAAGLLEVVDALLREMKRT